MDILIKSSGFRTVFLISNFAISELCIEKILAYGKLCKLIFEILEFNSTFSTCPLISHSPIIDPICDIKFYIFEPSIMRNTPILDKSSISNFTTEEPSKFIKDLMIAIK